MNSTILAAIIGGSAGAIISLLSSYFITRLKIRQEVRVWNTDFAVSYSKLLFEDERAARQLARQFAVGLVIVRNVDGSTHSKHFIPYQCKISVGRSTDNDIVLPPADRTVSRDHGIFFYRGNKIMFQELSPLNKTRVNGKEIEKICHLRSGDHILLGNTLLEFEELK